MIRIKIDLGDDSIPQELILSRNDTFSCTWVINQVHIQKLLRKIHQCELTIPDWAKHTLHQKLNKMSKELNWNGVCPKPFETSHYR